MSVIEVSPKDFGIDEASRIVIYVDDLKFFDHVFKNPGEIIPVDFSSLNKDSDFSAVIKYQLKREGKWKQVVPSKRIKIKVRNLIRKIKQNKLRINALTDDATISSDQISYLFKGYNESYELRRDISRITSQFLRNVWSDKTGRTDKVEFFLNEAKKFSSGGDEDFLEDIIFYINAYTQIADRFSSHGLRKKDYLSVIGEVEKNDNLRNEIFGHIISMCDERPGLQSSLVIRGMIQSYLNKRDEASSSFRKAIDNNSEFIDSFYLDMGAYTYGNPDNERNILFDNIIDIVNINSDNNFHTTILISVDEVFLRRYGAYIFYMCHIFEDISFHFHIVSDRGRVLSEEASEFFERIVNFSGQERGVIPSFSFSSVPNYVSNDRAYYACARYLVAKRIMQETSTNLYIMDMDLFFKENPKKYLNEISKFDVCLPVSRGTRSIPPWRRFQAGNVFIKNNKNGILFLDSVEKYILSFISRDNSWMLDQNALSYAVEMTMEIIDIGSYSHLGVARPIEQLAIAADIEKRK